MQHTEIQQRINNVTTDYIKTSLQQITPVVRDNNGKIWGVDVSNIDFQKETFINDEFFKELFFEVAFAALINKIDSYHSYTAPSIFIPTLAEAFAFIPKLAITRPDIVAFEIRKLNGASSFKEGFHKAQIIFYEKYVDFVY